MRSNLPKIAGLMVFSDYPQQFFPQLCITAIRVPGTMLGAVVKGDGRRFIDNRRLAGPISDMLEDLNITENRYSGIPAIFEACRAHSIPPPVFVNLKGEFRIVFRNNETALELTHAVFDPTRPKESVIAYCRVPRSRSELVTFTGMSHYYTMSEFGAAARRRRQASADDSRKAP